jgi:DNA-binding beta-propeller fold protein YncE
VSVLAGRDGMPRSLGSVYGGAVTRFLGVGRVVSRVIDTPGVVSVGSGLAVTCDGSTLLVVDSVGGSHAMHEFSVADGTRLRVVGGCGDGPQQLFRPRQLHVAPNGFVFVADCFNDRVQVLTPSLDFHGTVGAGLLQYRGGVCGNADVVVVSEANANTVAVFRRSDGALRRRFGCTGGGSGELCNLGGLCFLSRDGDSHVAVEEFLNDRVSVFTVDGDFVRHVSVDVVKRPHGVACSAYDELAVADFGRRRVVVFSASGEVLSTIGDGYFTGVAMHDGVLYALDYEKKTCLVFVD